MRLVGKSQTLSNFNQNSKENNSYADYTYVNNQECNEDRKYTYNCLNTNQEKKEETNTTCEMLKDNILSVPSKICSSLLNVKCRRVFYPSNANHKMEESKDLKTKPCESKTEENSERYSNSELQNTEPQITKKNNILDPINLSIPSLIVEIISIKEGVNYQLEVTDLKRVFSKFGPVSDVNIIGDSKTKAIILMEDLSHGRQAEKCLNFYKLSNSGAYLTVKWNFNDCENIVNDVKFETQESHINLIEKAQNNEYKIEEDNMCRDYVLDSASTKTPKKIMKENSDCMSTCKFTCKYAIPISSIPGFSVARKIIGYKGRNMKKILEKLKQKREDFTDQNEVKLRLRGQGSGYKEGTNKCESLEPLHLCISSKNFQRYTEACNFVEILLYEVLKEYNYYCKCNEKPTVEYTFTKVENNPALYYSSHSQSTKE